ncbi:Na+/H+ antiporter subunit E [Marinobacter mobilis]|uniref:Multisubunit potassium/proton antiporter, PhaE subunit (TC 2.A.63.1.1) n=1 Tax=Marinobacter mobilis TaxID=488533 RepID=A0A1H2SYS3_9GAMM|nr:Na+/H+ antiporter subunit E [Marinobacter mobilis]SDW36876.1 multisubunit potassium/proton antiporter, PhaE subunit (TC 2.A.63.1.1) [Marinobacter mobilis]
MLARIGLPQPFLSLVLFIVWQLLSDGISGGSIVMGLILAWVLPQVTRGFWPERPAIVKGWLVPLYILRVLLDIVVASLSVARLVLSTRKPRPAFISYPISLEHPLAITMLASTISLTPGTVSTDVSDDQRILLIHALDVDDEQDIIDTIRRRYEKPLQEIFQ